MKQLLTSDSDNDGSLNRYEIDADYTKFIPLLPVNCDTIGLYSARLDEANEIDVANADELTLDGSPSIAATGGEQLIDEMNGPIASQSV